MRYYRTQRDTTPRLIIAKYRSICSCGKQIQPGDEILYYPAARKAECRECATETLNLLADEAMAARERY